MHTNRRVFIFQVECGGRDFAGLEVRKMCARRAQSAAVVNSCEARPLRKFGIGNKLLGVGPHSKRALAI